MANPTLSEIIAALQEVSKQASAYNTELSAKLDLAILDLQKLGIPSKTDKYIDRTKKISEILAPFMKILYEYFNGS